MENDNFKSMGEKARNFSEEFLWEKQIQKYLELIKS